MTGLTDLGDLSPDVQGALRRHILTLADSKRLLGIRYSDWLLGAPTLETGIAASSMAQDEWGHARLLYAMLKDLGENPTDVEHDREPEAYANMPALDHPFSDWAGVVAAMVLLGGALSVALEGFAEGRYEAARSRIPKMLAEAEFHRDMGLAWVRRLQQGNDEARTRLKEAFRAALPSTLAWLAPDDEAYRRLVAEGLTAPGDTLHDRFVERYGPVVALVGVEMPEPDRQGWDEDRARGPGAPGMEAVERARGDQNRALFVE